MPQADDQWVLTLRKETHKTVVLITHSLEEALLLGQRLIVMAPRPGRILREYRLPFADAVLMVTSRLPHDGLWQALRARQNGTARGSGLSA